MFVNGGVERVNSEGTSKSIREMHIEYEIYIASLS